MKLLHLYCRNVHSFSYVPGLTPFIKPFPFASLKSYFSTVTNGASLISRTISEYPQRQVQNNVHDSRCSISIVWE